MAAIEFHVQLSNFNSNVSADASQVFKLFKSTSYKVSFKQMQYYNVIDTSLLKCRLLYYSQHYNKFISADDSMYSFKFHKAQGDTCFFVLKLMVHSHHFQEDAFKTESKYNATFKLVFSYGDSIIAEMNHVEILAKKEFSMDCFGRSIANAKKRSYAKRGICKPTKMEELQSGNELDKLLHNYENATSLQHNKQVAAAENLLCFDTFFEMLEQPEHQISSTLEEYLNRMN